MSFTRLSPGIWQIAVENSQQNIFVDDIEYKLEANNTYQIVVKKVGRIDDDTSKIKAKFNPLTEPGAFKNN